MTSFIAVFRGLNVGGSHKVPMAELRSVLEGLGLSRVRTYIQSGNAVFGAVEDEAAVEALAQRIEAAFERAFGFRTPAALRSLGQWRAAVAACPFTSRHDQPQQVHVGFCRSNPDPERLAALGSIGSGADEIVASGLEVYLHTPDGLGRSRLGNALVSRNLGTTITLRNWRTVEALEQMAPQSG
ncbi:MAG TPA: DUF1697 domain-containing protein [Phycisphaerae bacterium]|nr:DUF1697 domain-containing protein [Phycisphaerae bacterium]